MSNGDKTTRILQKNSSNSDGSTKDNEMLSTINDNKAEITVVAEANVETEDNDKTISRNIKFQDNAIESKIFTAIKSQE